MFKPPQYFEFSKPELWKDWIRFQRFWLASKLDKERGVIQTNSLLYSMGAEAEKVFAQLTFGDDERDKYDVLVKKLDDFLRQPPRNLPPVNSRQDSGPGPAQSLAGAPGARSSPPRVNVASAQAEGPPT